MFNQQLYTVTFQRWISGQWLMMFLLGTFTCAAIVAGGAIMYLVGDVLIPLVLVLCSVVAVQYYVTTAVRRCARNTAKDSESIRQEFNNTPSPLFLTATQQFFLTRSQTDTSTGLIILAVRKEDPDRLREVLASLAQDFGHEFVWNWLRQLDLTAMEQEWIFEQIHSIKRTVHV
jgi:hypothetical protein